MSNYISHNTGPLYTVVNAAEIVIFNGTYEQAWNALIEKGVGEPNLILSAENDPSVFLPTLIAAMNVDRETAKVEGEDLRAQLQALTDYVSELSAEMDEQQNKRSLENRIRAIQVTLRDRIPAHRKYLAENTIPNFDTNADSLVLSHLIQTTELGRELTVLKGLLNG